MHLTMVVFINYLAIINLETVNVTDQQMTASNSGFFPYLVQQLERKALNSFIIVVTCDETLKIVA